MLGCLLAWCLFLGGPARAEEHAKPPIVIATTAHHEVEKFDLADAKQRADFFEKIVADELNHVEVEKPIPNPIVPAADLGVWAR